MAIVSLAIAQLAACSADDGGAADAGPDAAPDAPQGACDAGEVEVQGDWVDWDSGNPSFLGIFDATISEGPNTVMTAPNGRAIICLTSGSDHRLDFAHTDYLPMSAALAAANLGSAYSVRGLTPLRADDLFATELALTRDVAAAQILVQLPQGATASLDTISAGTFSVLGNAYMFFANVPVGDGEVALTISPPANQSCSAVATLEVGQGVTAFTSVDCD